MRLWSKRATTLTPSIHPFMHLTATMPKIVSDDIATKGTTFPVLVELVSSGGKRPLTINNMSGKETQILVRGQSAGR